MHSRNHLAHSVSICAPATGRSTLRQQYARYEPGVTPVQIGRDAGFSVVARENGSSHQFPRSNTLAFRYGIEKERIDIAHYIR